MIGFASKSPRRVAGAVIVSFVLVTAAAWVAVGAEPTGTATLLRIANGVISASLTQGNNPAAVASTVRVLDRFAGAGPLSLRAVLDSAQCVVPQGDVLVLAPCGDDPDQAVTLDTNGRLHLADGRCVDAEDRQVRAASCDTATPFAATVDPASWRASLTPQNAPGQCLDLPHGATASGTQVQTYPCHGGRNQAFELFTAQASASPPACQVSVQINSTWLTYGLVSAQTPTAQGSVQLTITGGGDGGTPLPWQLEVRSPQYMFVTQTWTWEPFFKVGHVLAGSVTAPWAALPGDGGGALNAGLVVALSNKVDPTQPLDSAWFVPQEVKVNGRSCTITPPPPPPPPTPAPAQP